MLTPANYVCAYKRALNGQISLCFHVFLLSVAPKDDWTLTDVLASFRLNLSPVPLLSWIYSHRTHFCWALEVWSQFFFVLPFSVSVPASYHPFPVVWIKRLWWLHNGAICWSRPNTDSKPFAPVLEQNHLIWGHRMDVVRDVCEMLSMHLSFTQTLQQPLPVQG